MGNQNANMAGSAPLNYRLRMTPSKDHMTDKYEDLDTEFDPLLFSSLERYFPRNLLDASRESKHAFTQDILRRYSNKEELNRVQRIEQYKQNILCNYQPLYRELHTINHSMSFFSRPFLEAFEADGNNKEQSIRTIMTEVTPGVYTFDMLDVHFCEKLVSEVQHFEEWARDTNSNILRPSTGNEYGVRLDDIGMKGTLDKLMEYFISLISTVLFPDVGGCSLDSHHGYVLQYGVHRGVEEGFHVDDSEVTLNVCLGADFTGGDLYFGGQRCNEHVNSGTNPKKFVYRSLLPGHAIIHRGCQRNGAKVIKSGDRFNLVMWCRSSVFREMQKHVKGFKNFCEECQRKKRARIYQKVVKRKKDLGL